MEARGLADDAMTDTIPTPTIGEILDLVHGKRRLSTDMALRLSRFFGTSERFWINLQSSIDVRNRKPKMAPELEKIHPIRVSA